MGRNLPQGDLNHQVLLIDATAKSPEPPQKHAISSYYRGRFELLTLTTNDGFRLAANTITRMGRPLARHLRCLDFDTRLRNDIV